MRLPRLSGKRWATKMRLREAVAILVGLTLLPACGLRGVPAIPDGYVFYVGHTNNMVGSALAVYPDGRAAYRRLDGRIVRFTPSTSSIRRLNSALQQPELVPQLKRLKIESSGYVDSEEWGFSFGGGNYQIACGRVVIPAATLELVEAARYLAQGGSDEIWFLGPEPRLKSTSN